jgi:peptide deformylase
MSPYQPDIPTYNCSFTTLVVPLPSVDPRQSIPLQIIQYPHPTLRHVSKPLKRVDAELRRMVREMFELMYASNGVGLAANQVDLPYRLFLVNLKGNPREGEEHVFINPVISRAKGLAEAEEGCLSLPGLYADVKRPAEVSIQAYNLDGQEVRHELSGLFARVVQHELDHLNGKLLIDRLSPTSQIKVREDVEEFELEFAGRRGRGEIPSDKEIAARLAEFEKLRT